MILSTYSLHFARQRRDPDMAPQESDRAPRATETMRTRRFLDPLIEWLRLHEAVP